MLAFSKVRRSTKPALHYIFEPILHRGSISAIVSVETVATAILLFLNPDHFSTMWRDRDFEFPGEFAKILLPPKISHQMFAREFQIGPVGGDGCIGFS
jgi:hypothetical protein